MLTGWAVYFPSFFSDARTQGTEGRLLGSQASKHRNRQAGQRGMNRSHSHSEFVLCFVPLLIDTMICLRFRILRSFLTRPSTVGMLSSLIRKRLEFFEVYICGSMCSPRMSRLIRQTALSNLLVYPLFPLTGASFALLFGCFAFFCLK